MTHGSSSIAPSGRRQPREVNGAKSGFQSVQLRNAWVPDRIRTDGRYVWFAVPVQRKSLRFQECVFSPDYSLLSVIMAQTPQADG